MILPDGTAILSSKPQRTMVSRDKEYPSLKPTNWIYTGTVESLEHGLFRGQPVLELPPGTHGFVYKITRLMDGKFYIGCKKAKFKVTKQPLKGKKRKRRSFLESDWKTYWGSSNELKADVGGLGHEEFIREIMHFCSSQWELKYTELKEQLKYDVMNPNVNTYNGIINVRLNRPRGKQ